MYFVHSLSGCCQQENLLQAADGFTPPRKPVVVVKPSKFLNVNALNQHNRSKTKYIIYLHYTQKIHYSVNKQNRSQATFLGFQ